jgi:hypothetical protein
MSAERRRLENRRLASTFDLDVAGLRYKVTAGYFPEGALAEFFISNHKAGNASDVAARDAGILLSLLLQYGCPIETIAHALSRNSNGTASGVIGAAVDKIMGGAL